MGNYRPKFKWAYPTTLKKVGNMWAFSPVEWKPGYQRGIALFSALGKTPDEAERNARVKMNQHLDRLAESTHKQIVFSQDIADKIIPILQKQKKTVASLSSLLGIKRDVVKFHLDALVKKYIVRRYEQKTGKYQYTYYVIL